MEINRLVYFHIYLKKTLIIITVPKLDLFERNTIVLFTDPWYVNNYTSISCIQLWKHQGQARILRQKYVLRCFATFQNKMNNKVNFLYTAHDLHAITTITNTNVLIKVFFVANMMMVFGSLDFPIKIIVVPNYWDSQ